MAPATMRVGLELTALELDLMGTARAVEHLREELEQRTSVELVPIAQPRRAATPGGRLGRGLAREALYMPLSLPWRARRLELDLLHCPSALVPLRAPVPLVVTINDLMVLEHPEWFTRANRLQHRLVLGPALRRAACVLTPSEYTRDRVCERFGIDPARVVVAPYGIDGRFTPGPAPERLLERLGVDGPYVLSVGTLQPRKNVEAAVRAFERVVAAGAPHRLVVVGARGWLDSSLLALLGSSGLAERILVTGRLSDEELIGLYRGTDCFVFPSRYEGFGFPPLEAMACGAPVVSSDRTSLPEMLGDAAMLVDPDDVDALERALAEVLGSFERRRDLSTSGLARSARFTWSRCAELTVGAYEQALAAGAGGTGSPGPRAPERGRTMMSRR